MEVARPERFIAAVVLVDVVGYSSCGDQAGLLAGTAERFGFKLALCLLSPSLGVVARIAAERLHVRLPRFRAKKPIRT